MAAITSKSSKGSSVVDIIIGSAVTIGVIYLTVRLISKAWKAGQN